MSLQRLASALDPRRLWSRLARPEMAGSVAVPKLVAGLGNPGGEYGRHRHNIGWMVVGELAQGWGANLSHNRLVHARVDVVRQGGRRVILAQPTTYMNNSGEALSSLVQWYKIMLDDILIVYDDKDLPLGKVRLRTQGSAGSHNGMASIIQKLGTERINRLRVGIGPKPAECPLQDFVLSPFTRPEEELRQQAVLQAVEAVKSFVMYGPEVTMQNFN